MLLIESATAKDFVAPVIEAVTVTLDSMFGSNVKIKEVSRCHSEILFDVSSIIGLAGDFSGSFCLSVPKQTLRNAVKRFLDIDVLEIDQVCRGTLNELLNVIVGYAKDQMTGFNLKLGLPTAVQGRGVAINYPQNSEPLRLEFESDLGCLLVVIGLVREDTGVK